MAAEIITGVAGLVLAGGGSRRFGEIDKAQAILGDRRLIDHVVGRLAGQTDRLAVSSGERDIDLGEARAERLDDGAWPGAGPLAGVLAGLRWLRAAGGPDWLLTAPCDVPFLPLDVAATLLAARSGTRPVVARSAHGPEWAIALWNLRHAEVVETILREGGRRSLTAALTALEATFAPVTTAPAPGEDAADAFLNINIPEDLRRAEAMLFRLAPPKSA